MSENGRRVCGKDVNLSSSSARIRSRRTLNDCTIGAECLPSTAVRREPSTNLHGLPFSGTGTFYYANGATYAGEWRSNQKHGPGVFVFEDGSVFDGLFAHDRMADGRQLPGPAQGPLPSHRQQAQNVLLQHGLQLKRLYQVREHLRCTTDEMHLLCAAT